MTIEEFDNEHGIVVTSALASYSERMRETAQKARDGAASPAPKHSATPSTINVRPTSAGMLQMARAFDEAADRADAALKAWEAETVGLNES